MDVAEKRLENSKRRKVEQIKALLKNYKRDLDLIPIIKEKIATEESKLDIKASLKDSEVVSGGGMSQDDRLTAYLDKKRKLELELVRIEIKYRTLDFVVNSLDEESKRIIKDVRIYHKISMRDLGDLLSYSKTALYRKSDDALLTIYEQLKYIGDLDVEV